MGVNNKGLETSSMHTSACVCVWGGRYVLEREGERERVTGDELDIELCPQGLKEC